MTMAKYNSTYSLLSSFRPTIASNNLFQNPYGPPFYPRQRPLIDGTSASPLKKKARRMQKMIKIRIPMEDKIKNSIENPSLTYRSRNGRSKSLSRHEELLGQAKNDLNR